MRLSFDDHGGHGFFSGGRHPINNGPAGPCICTGAAVRDEVHPNHCATCGGLWDEPEHDRVPTAPEGVPVSMAELVGGAR